MLLDWTMKENFIKLKERVGHRGEWLHWTYERAYRKAENQKEELFQ